MDIKSSIFAKLEKAFSPISLEVLDESDRHKGHGGWREGGQTHFRVRIVSDVFTGMGRLARHRAVNDLLEEEFQMRMHALAIEARAPDEIDPREAKVTRQDGSINT